MPIIRVSISIHGSLSLANIHNDKQWPLGLKCKMGWFLGKQMHSTTVDDYVIVECSMEFSAGFIFVPFDGFCSNKKKQKPQKQ